MAPAPGLPGQQQRPAVIVLAGPPCAGKSTLGAWLARQLPAVHLQVDTILTAILPDSIRCLQDRLLACDVAAHAVRPILERNLSVILDFVYSRKEFRRQVVTNTGPDDPLVVIEFRVAPEAALARFENRPCHDATDLTRDIVCERAKSYPYGHGTAVVDGEGTTEAIREQVFHILRDHQPLDRQRWVDGGV